ncbi:unnamed protein product [Symbiodinium natans]|uniref:Pseudouridine synthase RsuA/RluA-like domain-containing protein n=1 Tax=Symbiodinium natans TaxID=878477 RepID=A0A812IKI5_9DINO|nr:unnamed protein product [Symbiodinium natans]
MHHVRLDRVAAELGQVSARLVEKPTREDGKDLREANRVGYLDERYYKKESDGSEYSLVYVNILSGITHQVRITLKSLGHPLVSDDRYLPRTVAFDDATWCPRNFLVEVRSDWFDMCGPYKDRKRRAYSRISIENPLPKLFQDILDTKLTMTEKLDNTADMHLGCASAPEGIYRELMGPKGSEGLQDVSRALPPPPPLMFPPPMEPNPRNMVSAPRGPSPNPQTSP